MERKSKISYEDRIKACEDYIGGKGSTSQIATDIGVSPKELRTWVNKYRTNGPESLMPKQKKDVIIKLLRKQSRFLKLASSSLDNNNSFWQCKILYKDEFISDCNCCCIPCSIPIAHPFLSAFFMN